MKRFKECERFSKAPWDNAAAQESGKTLGLVQNVLFTLQGRK